MANTSAGTVLLLLFFPLLCAGGEDRRPFLEDGGWRTYLSDILVEPGPCHLPIEDGTLTQAEFLKKYGESKKNLY